MPLQKSWAKRSRNLQSKFSYNLYMNKSSIVLLVILIFMTSSTLFAKGNKIVTLTDNNCLSTLIKSKKPVVIKFWAPWCKPCKKMNPRYKKAAQKFTDKVMFAELNTDRYKSTAAKYRVRGIPTLILFKNNKIVKRTTGSLSQKAIENFVKSGL